jgi:hypothetical protein
MTHGMGFSETRSLFGIPIITDLPYYLTFAHRRSSIYLPHTADICQCFMTEHWWKIMKNETNFPQCSVVEHSQKIASENERKIVKITIYSAFYNVPVRKNDYF